MVPELILHIVLQDEIFELIENCFRDFRLVLVVGERVVTSPPDS